jgi:methionyl aminopeptidase
MVYSNEDIERIRKADLLVSRTLAEVGKLMKDGVTTEELDKVAEEFIRDNGAIPGFLGYGGFPNTLCISENNKIVHGIPSKKVVLKNGDIVSVDCGAIVDGFNGDSAYTFVIGEIDKDVEQLLKVTREALYKGIEAAKVGNRIGDIGYAIQSHVESFGYGVVRELVGHGVGRNLHEKPQVPNYGKRGNGKKIKEGTVIAIEPMITMGSPAVRILDDGWTFVTADNSFAAHFEHSIAVKKDGADILSSFEIIEQALNLN